MKKLNYLVLGVLGIVLISCGGKNSENKEMNEISDFDCGCNELNLERIDEDNKSFENRANITKNGSKELFTGVCYEKDQNDTIIKKVSVKNGYKTHEEIKVKLNNRYVIDKDIAYENGEINDGFNIDSPTYYYEDKDHIEYIPGCSIYSKSKTEQSWSFEYNKYDGYEIKLSFPDASENNIEKLRPKSLKGAEFVERRYSWSGLNANLEEEQGFKISNLSEKDFFTILDKLKKELPHFDYWKI
jgi:hypothetical protein